MDKLEYVCGLRYGSNFFKSGDEVIFKIKDDSAEYAAELYDIGKNSFIAYSKDNTEYDFSYDCVEWMKAK